jgi:serine/threonine-protein kinase
VTLPSLVPGALFGSRWIVGRVLGKNELAVVYEAEESREARFAALKLFDTALVRDAEAWQRFATLTSSLASVMSDGIAKSYQVGTSDGRPFVASERCLFPTLSRYIADRGAPGARAFRETLRTLGGALDAAHAVGIVHGNLKPQNVFVSLDNPSWARLTDFGLAELREACGINPPRTLGWNAPEVSPGVPTAASDLFALGLVTFFALSGSPWYSAQRSKTSTGDHSRAASARARAFGGEIPPALDAWFDRALAREPAERFANAAEMANAFAMALEGDGPVISVAPMAMPPKSVGPLSATVPVAQPSPLAGMDLSPPIPSKLDPNGPTARQLAATEQAPAREPPAYASNPPPRTYSGPPVTQPISQHPAPAPGPIVPRYPSTVPPPSVILIALGAFLGGLAFLAVAWMIWARSR